MPELNILPCDSEWNCYRTSKSYAVSQSLLLDYSEQAVRQHGGRVSSVSADDLSLKSTFLIAGYTDDVAIQITSDETSSVLTIRSKSRVGTFDLFVNRVRVWGVMKKIDTLVAAEHAAVTNG